MTAQWLLTLNVALFVIHEMDAVRRIEWRMIFPINRLPDVTAHNVFCALHLPLFGLLFWMLSLPADQTALWLKATFDGFLVFHLGLHLVFFRHPENRFTSLFSHILIVAMALGGIWHALLILPIT